MEYEAKIGKNKMFRIPYYFLLGTCIKDQLLDSFSVLTVFFVD